MKKILLFILMFLIGVVLFMPKINLYYTLEDFAQKEHIQIKEKSITDRWIDLDIKDATLFYDGIASVDIAELTISPWIVYNTIKAKDVRPTKEIKRMLDVKASEVVMRYSLLDYKHIMIEASGDFGALHGTIDVVAQKVRLLLEPSAKFKHHDIVRQYFKKEEEGLVYESKL